jgi:CRISPR/Cas system-associated exonuclease Cas4 (RecB family)
MTDLKNEISWSPSRDKALEECPRAYYWRHYGSWGGWEDNAPDDARLAYRLKQIRGLDSWIGTVVHDVLADALGRAGAKRQIASADELCESVRMRMIKDWFASLDGAWKDAPKKHANLLEHYYKRPVTKERREQLRDKAFACIRTFRSSAILQEILDAGEWLTVESLMRFSVDDITVFAQPDFVVRPSNLDTNHVIIYDWKTGKSRPEDDFQMIVYSLLSAAKFQAEAEVVLFYLASGNVSRFQPTLDDKARVLERIRSSHATMRGLCTDAVKNTADIANFKMNVGQRCQRCEYFELCQRVDDPNPDEVPLW